MQREGSWICSSLLLRSLFVMVMWLLLEQPNVICCHSAVMGWLPLQNLSSLLPRQACGSALPPGRLWGTRVLCCCLEDWIGRELLSAKIREKYCCICMWEGAYLLLAPWTSRGGSTIKAGCWLLSVLRLKLRSLRETSHSPRADGAQGQDGIYGSGYSKDGSNLEEKTFAQIHAE